MAAKACINCVLSTIFANFIKGNIAKKTSSKPKLAFDPILDYTNKYFKKSIRDFQVASDNKRWLAHYIHKMALLIITLAIVETLLPLSYDADPCGDQRH